MDKHTKRVLKQVQLTSEEWDNLIKDIQEGENKKIIRAKYNLTNFQYKKLKEYLFD